MKGKFIAIVGPSGSGKDTLINALRERLQQDRNILFVRRVVTREGDRHTEDHASLDSEAFADAQASGKFAVSWQAHGLCYAIPAEVTDHVRGGGIAIANGSRRALAAIEKVFGALIVVSIEVERDVLRQRLMARGRELPAEIESRLDSAEITIAPHHHLVRIDNSGSLQQAVEALAIAITDIAAPATT